MRHVGVSYAKLSAAGLGRVEWKALDGQQAYSINLLNLIYVSDVEWLGASLMNIAGHVREGGTLRSWDGKHL